MIIQHNLSAMNADRQFGITRGKRGKSAEKLSSGYKINRAADDAAGLAVSEKMRRQIRGLTQASSNAQDGISMVQTAEGALNEVHDMLQRMNELCVKAANGTLTYEDRDYIQQEIRQTSQELDRVRSTTRFNDIKLLDGLPQTQCTAVMPTAKVNDAAGVVTQTSDDDVDARYEIAPIQIGDVAEVPQDTSGNKFFKAATKEQIQAYEQEWRDYEEALALYEIEKSIYDADPDAYGAREPAKPDEPIKHDGSSSDKAKLVEIEDMYMELAKNISGCNAIANSDVADGCVVGYSPTRNDGRFDIHFYGPLQVTLQVGSESDHTYSFFIKAVNSGSLGVDDINVRDTDGSGAREGIAKVKKAIEKNSRDRADLGAVQNRLEHMIRNLDNVVENTTASESRIRDTDMASEMQNYSTTDILAQAGQSILAQANQSKQGVLSLLQ